MVAPKHQTGDSKGKSGEKGAAISSSPEPFQEPDGMTTVDLNKSDEFSKEEDEEVENAKLKEKAQIKYLTRLLLFLGFILLVVSIFFLIAFVNTEFHIFTVIPLKINQSNPNHPHVASTSSPTEEFANLTKAFNQALFREKLKSGNYLENSYEEMNVCKLEQTLDACCEVFRDTDLYDLAEYCTVNDMLNILLEIESNRREKRQAFLVPQSGYADHLIPDYDQFPYPTGFSPELIGEPQPDGIDQLQFINPNFLTFEQEDLFERESPSVQSFQHLPLPKRTRYQILQHITIAPKQQKNYMYEDFHHDPVGEKNYQLASQESKSWESEEGTSGNFQKLPSNPYFPVHGETPKHSPNLFKLDSAKVITHPHKVHHGVFDVKHLNQPSFIKINEDIPTTNQVHHAYHENEDTIYPSLLEKNSDETGFMAPGATNQRSGSKLGSSTKTGVPNVETSNSGFGRINQKAAKREELVVAAAEPRHPIFGTNLKANINSLENTDKILREDWGETNFSAIQNADFAEDVTLGNPQKKPLVSKFGDALEVVRNNTGDSKAETSITIEGNADQSQIKIPPNLKITKKKDELEVLPDGARAATSGNNNFEINFPADDMSRMFQSSGNDEIINAETLDLMLTTTAVETDQRPLTSAANENVTPEEDDLQNPADILTPSDAEDVTLGNLQKKPLVSKFGSSLEVIQNSTSDAKAESSINIEGSPADSPIKIPPNLKITKKKDEMEVDTWVLSGIRDATPENNFEINIRPNVISDMSIEPSKTFQSAENDEIINSVTTLGLMEPNSRIIDTENESLTTEDYISPNPDDILGLKYSSRANTAQEDFRTKTKQLDGFTALEDVQSNQQTFVNPCFYPYMNPYLPFAPAPARVGNAQDPGFLKIISVSNPKVQSQPTYVLNPSMYYGIPPSPQPTYPSFPPNPYLPAHYYSPMMHAGAGQNVPVQVASPGGQYYICNPIPTPTNNIAGFAGVEVKRDASNLQNLMEELEDFAKNNTSREADLVCPLGEQACLDNSKCLKNHHICDSEVDCDDSSDEIACSCKERVGNLRSCDGYCDCPGCEDEQGCFGCEANEFSCDDWSRFRRSTCIHIGQRCDGIKQCEITGKDEMDCSILADRIGNFPLNKISNSVGFLHRNYKGKWYPTCFGTELWAAEICQVEAGPSAIIPKAHMTLTSNPYNGLFINILPNNEVSLVNTCVQDRAAYVECPPIYCGLRFLVHNPYRSHEVDTSVEDMLNDFERAYKLKEQGYERDDAGDADVDVGRFRKNVKRELDNLHLEEVIEKLERTFKRREVSGDEYYDATLKESRVVGGKASQPAAWPWLVSIYKNGIFHCGGVLINELWIVTASHCVDRYWQYYYEIQAGALRRFSYAPMDQRRWAKTVVPHEFYNKGNLRHDIALMKLSAPIRYNRYVRPICLPSQITAGQDFLKGPSPGTVCTTVGWGATVEHGTDPDHMREVEVPILQHCKHKEDSDVEEICAGLSEGGKDACQGDSGGPLMCRNPNNPNQWYLAGIVSHGEGCARPREPGVYTKVSRYIGWLAENTRPDKLTVTHPLQNCPGHVCKGTKRCIAKKRHCDRIVDCLLGDDEVDCENRFKDIFKSSRKEPPGEFVSDLAENLVPLEELGLLGSKLAEKDTNITARLKDEYFKCKELLQVVQMEKRCNKAVDCEDGSDESDCSCAEYIKTIDPTAICDGVTDCLDSSDENDCVKCNITEYTCRLSQKCIDISRRCDGNADCPQHEDEMHCASLTNDNGLVLDENGRPAFESRGIVTVNYQGQWTPLCPNSSSLFLHDEPSLATVICNLLGFDEYTAYHKYRTENAFINSSTEVKKTCDGLYISCSNTSTSSTLHYKSLDQVKELYASPWMATIYSNGLYKCMGMLLDSFWIITSAKCFTGIQSLQSDYAVAVLGKGKLHLTVKGPQEQVVRIGGSVTLKDTDIVLLRLESHVKFNRYVQAADLNARREGAQREKCYAAGRDNENKLKFVPLRPLKNCLVGYRCFEKKIEDNCSDVEPWGGTIICDSRVGWYPAAVYYEENGHCGFSHYRKYTSVKFYKNIIFKIMAFAPTPTPPPPCLGFRCPLGNCIAREKICDGISDCHDGADENASLCYEKENECNLGDKCVCPPTHLKCPSTNKCLPKSTFCDRTNDCGEFEDEPDVCSCRNYLKLTDPTKICDGALNCMDRSDEDPETCSCKLGDFQCGKLNKCVSQEMVCDGVRDCPDGEDEAKCMTLNTEGHESGNAGEVMTRTGSVWHSGCFNRNYSATELADICTKLGFNESSGSMLSPPRNLTTMSALRPVLDVFGVVWLRRQSGNKLKLRIRSAHEPYVKFVPDDKCRRLFVACI